MMNNTPATPNCTKVTAIVEAFGVDTKAGQIEREDDRGGDGQPVAGTQRQRTARLQRDEADADQTDHAGDQIDGLRAVF